MGVDLPRAEPLPLDAETRSGTLDDDVVIIAAVVEEGDLGAGGHLHLLGPEHVVDRRDRCVDRRRRADDRHERLVVAAGHHCNNEQRQPQQEGRTAAHAGST